MFPAAWDTSGASAAHAPSALPAPGVADLPRERAPGISPVVVHDSYGQVDLVNVLGRDIKDYGFVVNRVQSVPLGGCFPLLQSSAVTHQRHFHVGICTSRRSRGTVRIMWVQGGASLRWGSTDNGMQSSLTCACGLGFEDFN